MAMMRAIRMRIKTMSMQNLWGFLIFQTMPFNCLFDLKRSQLTLSTSWVSWIILLSDYFISSPVIRMLYFHVFSPFITYSISRSIYSSTFCHCFILVSYISVASSTFPCLEMMRLLFLGFPPSSNCSLISVQVQLFLPRLTILFSMSEEASMSSWSSLAWLVSFSMRSYLMDCAAG